MAMYNYKCVACGLEFEDFSSISLRYENKPCKDCGAVSERVMSSSFGVLTPAAKGATLYSRNEIDRAIGRSSEQKWGAYNEGWKSRYESIQSKRRGGQELKELPMEKGSDGKYAPLLSLGGKEDRQKRREYSAALKEHRAERKKKGLGQFDGPGI